MANFHDIMGLLGEGRGNQIAEEMQLDNEIKTKAIDLIDQAKKLIDESGGNGAEFIKSHLGGGKDEESEPPNRRKSMLIMELRRRNGK